MARVFSNGITHQERRDVPYGARIQFLAPSPRRRQLRTTTQPDAGGRRRMLIRLGCAHGMRASRDGGAVRLDRRCSPSPASRDDRSRADLHRARDSRRGGDRPHDRGEPTLLEPTGWGHRPGDPTLGMRGGPPPPGFWLVWTGHVVVRDGTTEDSPVIARVEPSWDNNAIRLTLRPADGPPIQSDVFERVGVGAAYSMLTRLANSSTEVPGTYQAAMRTSDGAEVGWLRVTVGGRPGSILWQGDLPASIDEVLAAATGPSAWQRGQLHSQSRARRVATARETLSLLPRVER